jgi:hypothetical protein
MKKRNIKDNKEIHIRFSAVKTAFRFINGVYINDAKWEKILNCLDKKPFVPIRKGET